MKKKIFVILFFMIIVMAASSLDIPAYIPIEFADFVKIFKTTRGEGPGIKIYRNNSFRVHANLPEYPREIDASDIENIKATLLSLGIHPSRASEFGYKVEYIYPSDVEWQKETRLVLYIQKVQREYFEKEFKINSPIYWFLVFQRFSTFSQQGHFLVSDFLNEEQFDSIVGK